MAGARVVLTAATPPPRTTTDIILDACRAHIDAQGGQRSSPEGAQRLFDWIYGLDRVPPELREMNRLRIYRLMNGARP